MLLRSDESASSLLMSLPKPLTNVFAVLPPVTTFNGYQLLNPLTERT